MSNASLADVSEDPPVVIAVAQDEELPAPQGPLVPRHPADGPNESGNLLGGAALREIVP